METVNKTETLEYVVIQKQMRKKEHQDWKWQFGLLIHIVTPRPCSRPFPASLVH